MMLTPEHQPSATPPARPALRIGRDDAVCSVAGGLRRGRHVTLRTLAPVGRGVGWLGCRLARLGERDAAGALIAFDMYQPAPLQPGDDAGGCSAFPAFEHRGQFGDGWTRRADLRCLVQPAVHHALPGIFDSDHHFPHTHAQARAIHPLTGISAMIRPATSPFALSIHSLRSASAQSAAWISSDCRRPWKSNSMEYLLISRSPARLVR